MKPLDLSHYTTTFSQDLLLSKRILNGEKELFELLVRPYDKALQTTLAAILGDGELTDRIVLRTYLRALKTLYRFYGQTSFAAWLFSIALEELRKNKKPLFRSPKNGTRLIAESQWLCHLLNKAGKLGQREIAFCLSTSQAEIRRDLKAAKKLVNEKIVSKPGKNTLLYRYNNLTKHLVRLLLSDTENDTGVSIEKEMDSIVAALFEENKKQETEISMNIEREHRENLMLCTYIRLGFIKGIEMHRIKSYADWYWQNHLLVHFKQEENVVFPVLGKNHDLVKKALAQHRRLKRLFESKDDIHKMLSRIEEELLAHVRFEEKILFKEIEKTESDKAPGKIAALHHPQDSENKWPDQFWK